MDEQFQRSYDKEKTLAEVARQAFENSEEDIQQQQARELKEAEYAQKVQGTSEKLDNPKPDILLRDPELHEPIGTGIYENATGHWLFYPLEEERGKSEERQEVVDGMGMEEDVAAQGQETAQGANGQIAEEEAARLAAEALAAAEDAERLAIEAEAAENYPLAGLLG